MNATMKCTETSKETSHKGINTQQAIVGLCEPVCFLISHVCLFLRFFTLEQLNSWSLNRKKNGSNTVQISEDWWQHL